MKAILIDPRTKTLEGIELPDDSRARMERIYALLGCSYVDCVRLDTGRDAVFVDDEGLLGDLSAQRFFWLEGTHSPLAGAGVIMGADEEGETVAPTIALDEVAERLHWVHWAPEPLDAEDEA